MMQGSHLGWLLCGMSVWNLYRVTNEEMLKEMNDYTTIIITLATVLTRCGRVAILAKAAQAQARRTQDKSEQTMFHDDLRERVAVLEQN